MAKELQLHCSRQICDLLVLALTQYAHAAYPPGGSECAQSSRESLLMAADRVRKSWQVETQTAVMSKRIRVMAKAAIRYYCGQLAEEDNGHAEAREAYLLRLFSGDVLDDAGYATAEQQDMDS